MTIDRAEYDRRKHLALDRVQSMLNAPSTTGWTCGVAAKGGKDYMDWVVRTADTEYWVDLRTGEVEVLGERRSPARYSRRTRR